jgi:ribonuclease T2
MTDDPVRYFAEEGRLYHAIRFPDMATLAHRRGLTAGDFQAAFAAANPGMKPDMMRLNVNKRGWLEEVWLCLGLDKRPRACPAGQGGAAPTDPVKVQAPA